MVARYAPKREVQKFFPDAFAVADSLGWTICAGKTDQVSLGSGRTVHEAWHKAHCDGCWDLRQRRAALGEPGER